MSLRRPEKRGAHRRGLAGRRDMFDVNASGASARAKRALPLEMERPFVLSADLIATLHLDRVDDDWNVGDGISLKIVSVGTKWVVLALPGANGEASDPLPRISVAAAMNAAIAANPLLDQQQEPVAPRGRSAGPVGQGFDPHSTVRSYVLIDAARGGPNSLVANQSQHKMPQEPLRRINNVNDTELERQAIEDDTMFSREGSRFFAAFRQLLGPMIRCRTTGYRGEVKDGLGSIGYEVNHGGRSGTIFRAVDTKEELLELLEDRQRSIVLLIDVKPGNPQLDMEAASDAEDNPLSKMLDFERPHPRVGGGEFDEVLEVSTVRV